MKTNEENRKLLSNQIATRNTKEKKAGQVELARKLDANVRVTNFRVQTGPLSRRTAHLIRRLVNRFSDHILQCEYNSKHGIIHHTTDWHSVT